MASEREGQTETQSTTTTVRKMILKPEHLREQPSVLRSMYRRLDITDTSFFHAVIMIATGITIVLQNASTYNIFEWTSTFYKSPTTDSIRYLFCFSIGYFVYDTIFVLRKVKRQVRVRQSCSEGLCAELCCLGVFVLSCSWSCSRNGC